MREVIAQAPLGCPWNRGSVPSCSDSFSDSQVEDILLICCHGFIQTAEVYQIGVNAFTQERILVVLVCSQNGEMPQGDLLVDGFFAAIGLAYELRLLCQAINAATTTRMVIFWR